MRMKKQKKSDKAKKYINEIASRYEKFYVCPWQAIRTYLHSTSDPEFLETKNYIVKAREFNTFKKESYEKDFSFYKEGIVVFLAKKGEDRASYDEISCDTGGIEGLALTLSVKDFKKDLVEITTKDKETGEIKDCFEHHVYRSYHFNKFTRFAKKIVNHLNFSGISF